ncbi:MAG: glycosyltransferase family 4 protein, partial [Anaerolineae bacterium]
MRQLLFITPQLPFPPEQGTALRNYNLLRLASRLAQVTLLSFAPGGAAVPAELAAVCSSVRLVESPPQRSIAERLRTLLGGKADMAERLHSRDFSAALGDILKNHHFDALQIEGIEMAPFALAAKPAICPPLIFDAHNAEWLLQRRAAQADWQRLTRWPTAFYSSLQWRRLQRLERRVCRTARLVLACSQADADALQYLDGAIQPHVLPNGVDTQRCQPGQASTLLRHPALVFTGKM